jgi:hypothetical protein
MPSLTASSGASGFDGRGAGFPASRSTSGFPRVGYINVEPVLSSSPFTPDAMPGAAAAPFLASDRLKRLGLTIHRVSTLSRSNAAWQLVTGKRLVL